MSKQLPASVEKATAYCTYCPKLCRFSCPAAEAENRETVTPWGMMRLFEYVRTGDVEPSEEVAEIFYHCMGCLRCNNWCRHDNDVPEAMWHARALMREQGFVPEALAGFSDYFLEGNSPHPESKALAEVSPDFEAAFDVDSAVVYMPDCETRHHFPSLVAKMGKLFEIVEGRKARLHTRDDGKGHACCGFPLLSAGDTAGYARYREELEFALAGADYVVTDCAAMAALHRAGGSFGNESPLRVVHLVEWLHDHLDTLEVPAPVDPKGLIFHDSCFVTRHLGLGDQTRAVLAKLVDGELPEFSVNGTDAPCCGGPSHYHVVAPEASRRCASDRVEQMEREGGERIVAASATCKKAFRRVAESHTATDLLEIVTQAFKL